MNDEFSKVYQQIIDDDMSIIMQQKGYLPLYTVSKNSKIVVIGQAPGKKAQEAMIPWQDTSGDTLRDWLGVSKEQFYDSNIIALLPMDFYYPGKGTHGDLPPRKNFAERWHPLLLENMPEIELTVLIGNYAQKHYLGKTAKQNLTETVRNFDEYLPQYFPLVHPSPLNFRWQAKNPWFKVDVIPKLQQRVQAIIAADS